jgi:hypothetical protein
MNIIKVGFIQCSSSDNLGNSRSQSYHFSPLVYGGATISLGQSEVTHPGMGPFANAYIPSFYKTDQFGNETRISNGDRSLVGVIISVEWILLSVFLIKQLIQTF